LTYTSTFEVAAYLAGGPTGSPGRWDARLPGGPIRPWYNPIRKPTTTDFYVHVTLW